MTIIVEITATDKFYEKESYKIKRDFTPHHFKLIFHFGLRVSLFHSTHIVSCACCWKVLSIFATTFWISADSFDSLIYNFTFFLLSYPILHFISFNKWKHYLIFMEPQSLNYCPKLGNCKTKWEFIEMREA